VTEAHLLENRKPTRKVHQTEDTDMAKNARRSRLFLSFLTVLLVLPCCRTSGGHDPGTAERPEIEAPPVSLVEHPQWSRPAAIYEVNIRQYSPEGTFEAFRPHLGRLRDLGVGILWLMPIHPIGQQLRKGSLGSYYSVKEYYQINEEFGTAEEFKALVDEIHSMGMHVILDWVANHSARDNPLAVQHPDWYMRDSQGQFFPPVPDWSDVIDLNYNNPDLREYMADAMAYWVREMDVDGFRCDVASMVPMDFWERVRRELDGIKPVFMLAEAEGPEFHHRAFDMTYAWGLYHIINDIAVGTRTADYLDRYLQADRQRYPPDAYRMNFTSNHDENSWNGTVFERLGESAEVMAVLTATLEGMPLIYSGQEAGLEKRLEFFEKDLIEWRDHPFAELYATLLRLKRDHRALWNGEWGGEVERVTTSDDRAVFAFLRRKGSDRVLAVLNLTAESREVTLAGGAFAGTYREVFSDQEIVLQQGDSVTLGPWGYGLYAVR
jgi:1,4-alpha-glucan branching enzyme